MRHACFGKDNRLLFTTFGLCARLVRCFVVVVLRVAGPILPAYERGSRASRQAEDFEA